MSFIAKHLMEMMIIIIIITSTSKYKHCLSTFTPFIACFLASFDANSAADNAHATSHTKFCGREKGPTLLREIFAYSPLRLNPAHTDRRNMATRLRPFWRVDSRNGG